MPDQATLAWLAALFWPVYLISLLAGAIGALVLRRWCLGRVVIALALASAAQTGWEAMLPPSGYLLWWMHLAIDLPLFVLITLPPRHYWQSVLGALVFAQLGLHSVWGLAPDFGQWHWLLGIVIGFAKCAVLVLWSGGARVESVLGWGAGLAARLVPVAPAGKLAR